MTKITSVVGKDTNSQVKTTVIVSGNTELQRTFSHCDPAGQKEYRLKETDPVVIVTFRRHYRLSGLSKAQLQRCGRPQFMRVRNDPMALDEIQRKTKAKPLTTEQRKERKRKNWKHCERNKINSTRQVNATETLQENGWIASTWHTRKRIKTKQNCRMTMMFEECDFEGGE